MKILIAALMLLAISGCASIAGEKTQPITFKTIQDNTEVAGIGCSITNDAGSWFVTTPGSVTVHKSTGDMAVDCKKEDLFGHETLISKSNGAVWGNILAGGGIGYIVDRNTGAGFNYPDNVTIKLNKVGDATAPANTTKPSNNPTSGGQETKNDPKITSERINITSNIDSTAKGQESGWAKKLEELQSLKDKNLITQEEYDTKRKSLLNNL